MVVRLNEDGSDITVAHWENGDFSCMHCKFMLGIRVYDNVKTVFVTSRDMLAHLLAHRHAGHGVPQFAVDRVNARGH